MEIKGTANTEGVANAPLVQPDGAAGSSPIEAAKPAALPPFANAFFVAVGTDPEKKTDTIFQAPAVFKPVSAFDLRKESLKLWSSLNEKFGVPKSFLPSHNPILEKMLEGRSADEIIAFFDALVSAFPEANPKDIWGDAEIFEDCQYEHGHNLLSIGIESNERGEAIQHDGEYLVCRRFGVLGRAEPGDAKSLAERLRMPDEGESAAVYVRGLYEMSDFGVALSNLMELYKQGPDVIPFLKSYLADGDEGRGERFDYAHLNAYLAAYRHEQAHPGFFARRRHLRTFLHAMIPDAKFSEKSLMVLSDIAERPQGELEGFKKFVAWMKGRGWKDGLERAMADHRLLDFCFRLSTLDGFADAAGEMITSFRLREAPESLGAVESFLTYRNNGGNLKELQTWIEHFDSDPDYSWRSSHGNDLHNPKAAWRKRYGRAIPEVGGKEFNVNPEYHVFLRAIYDANPKVFLHLVGQIGSTMSGEQGGSDFEDLYWSIQHRKEVLAQAGRKIEGVHSEDLRRMAPVLSDMLEVLGIPDGNGFHLWEGLFRYVNGFHTEPCYADRLSDWNPADERKFVALLEKLLGQRWGEMRWDDRARFLLLRPENKRRLLMWSDEHGGADGDVPTPILKMAAENFPELALMQIVLHLASFDDPKKSPMYESIIRHQAKIIEIPPGTRRDAELWIHSLGIGFSSLNIEERYALSRISSSRELKKAYEDFGADARRALGYVPVTTEFENLLPLYLRLKAEGGERDFWMLARDFEGGPGKGEVEARKGFRNAQDLDRSLKERRLAFSAEVLLPKWVTLKKEERSEIAAMVHGEAIYADGRFLEHINFDIQKALDAYRRLIPFAAERQFITEIWKKRVGISELLVGGRSDPDKDFFAKVRFLEWNRARYEKLEDRFETFYAAKITDQASDVHAFVGHLADFISDVSEDVFRIPGRFETVVMLKKNTGPGVHPWVADAALRYQYHLSDHWFLENWDRIKELFPELKRLASGGREKLFVAVKELIAAQPVHKERIVGRSFSEREEDNDLERLSTADLAKVWLVLKSLQSSTIRDELGGLLERDFWDKRSEYGGTDRFTFVPIEPKEKGDDGAYVLNDTKYYRNGLASYHFHSVASGSDAMNEVAKRLGVKDLDNTFFAGPSDSDLVSASSLLLDNIVVTRFSDESFNVDFYIPDGDPGYRPTNPVIDLGLYYHNANKGKRNTPAPEEPAPEPQEPAPPSPRMISKISGEALLSASSKGIVPASHDYEMTETIASW